METQGQLGEILTWRVPAGVELARLRDALQETGFNADLVPDLHPRNAMRRALRDMREARVIRQLREENGCIYFQLTHEELSPDRAEYVREAVLVLNTQTGVVYDEFAGGLADQAVEAGRLLREHQARRLAADLTRLIQRIVESVGADLIPIRDQGGAYFVPDAHRELVARLRSLTTAIGGQLRTFAVRLGSAETSASVAESLADYLGGLVAELRAEIDALGDDAKGFVIARRSARVGELRQRLEAYRGLLAGFADGIGTQLDATAAVLLSRMAQPKLKAVGV